MNVKTCDQKQLLRDWVKQHASRPLPADFDDETPILEQRLVSSLKVMELLIFIEKNIGRPVQVCQVKPGSFRDINTIFATFFVGEVHEAE